jgi:hypothetical protein
MEDALTAIRRLDAIVVNRLRGDRTAIAAWERARHVDRPSRARNGAAEPAAPAPLPAATLSPPQPSAAPAPDAVPTTTV